MFHLRKKLVHLSDPPQCHTGKQILCNSPRLIIYVGVYQSVTNSGINHCQELVV